GVELAQFTDPNDANHPIYLGQIDTDNDGTVNGLDTDLDGNGTADENELYVTLNSGVLAGNVDALPIPYITSSSDGCPANASPSEMVGNIALVYHDAGYGCSFSNTGYSATQYTVKEGISYQFNTAIPLYQIGPHQLAPTGFRLNETYPMLRLPRAVKYDIYEVTLNGSDWVATKLQTVEVDDIPDDNWLFINQDVSERTTALNLMAVPEDLDIYGELISNFSLVQLNNDDTRLSFSTRISFDAWRYRLDGGEWITAIDPSVVLTGLSLGQHTAEMEIIDADSNPITAIDSQTTTAEIYAVENLTPENTLSFDYVNHYTGSEYQAVAMLPGSGLTGPSATVTPNFWETFELDTRFTVEVKDAEGNAYPVMLKGHRIYNQLQTAMHYVTIPGEPSPSFDTVNYFHISLDSGSFSALPTGVQYHGGVVKLRYVTSAQEELSIYPFSIDFTLPYNDFDGDGIEDGIDLDLDGDGVQDTVDVNSYSVISDTDGDGMGDGFETTYGLDPLTAGDESGDLDGDGFINLVEYQDGSDPTDNTSFDTDHDGILDPDDAEPTVWNNLATGERLGVTTVSTGHERTEYTSPVVRIMTEAHTRSEDMYVPYEDYNYSLKSHGSNYMPKVAYSAVSNGTKDGVVWQDQTTMAVYYSEFNSDGTHNRTITLPNAANENLLSATSNGAGDIVYGLGATGGAADKVTPTTVRLTRYNLNSQSVVASQTLNTDKTGTGAIDVWKIGNYPSKLAWSGDRIGLNLLRTYTQTPSDGLNHQGGGAYVYDANTLNFVKSWGQISGHQFGGTLMVDGQGNFISTVLGDAYPRGINILQWNDSTRYSQNLLRIKTLHGRSPNNPAGVTFDEYTEISTPTTTFYKWSNDNRTYSELAGVVEMDDRFLSFMSSERGLRNDETGQAHNKSRNIAVVATGKDLNENEYLSFGEYETTSFYDFGGAYRQEINRNVVWLTDFTDIQDNISRLKPLKLADNVILLLMEFHTYDGYDYSAYMMVNKELQVLVPLTRMRQDIIFGRSHEPRVENGTAYGYSSANGKLQRFTISLNGDPTIDTDNDGYSDYYEQLLASDANDPNSPLANGDLDTDSDGIPNHMDYDDDADGISDMDDSDPLDPNTDYDGDGLSDGYEMQAGLNPYDNSDGMTDTDNDGLRDALELAWNLNPLDSSDGANVDSDGDGFSNLTEIGANTDPLDPNAYDGDLDGVHGIYDVDDTDPLSDSDGDSIADIVETQNGLNPLDATDVDFSIDSDNDSMADIWETIFGLNVGVDDSFDDLDGDGINNITELNNGNAADDPNDPVYLGNLDTDNDGIVNGLDTDLDGDGVEDNIQSAFPVLSSSVLSGIVGTVINDICNVGPSEDDKHEVIYLVQSNPDSNNNNNCYRNESYADTNFTVATTVNPSFGALPHYRISPPANSASAFFINPTKMFIKVAPSNYTLYQLVSVNSSWAYTKVMDIAGTDFNPNGFVFIDRKFNEITSDVYLVMVPVGTDMSGVTVDTSGTYNTLGAGSTNNGGSTGSSSDTVLNLDDPASGTYVRDGVLEVGTITLPGDITVRPNDVAANWPSGQSASSCSGPDNSEYAHTLYLAVGADFKFTDYGCYPNTSWSHHDFDVTVFLANVAGEGVY
ncbi:hypothetical protein BTO00_22755, partial [Vibrio campbellii]